MNPIALIPAVFGGVIVFVGFVFWLITRFMKNSSMDRTTTGRVVDMTRDAEGFNEDQGQPADSRRSRIQVRVHVSGGNASIRYYHKVYTYAVGSITYTRADPVQYSSNLAKKSIGQDVIVHYDSADPGYSCLEGSKAFTIVYRILFGVGLALLALAAWLWLA